MKNKSKILLSDIKKDIHLNIPENYHEELSNVIMQKTNESILEKLKNESGVFITPNQYFESLEIDIISKTSDQNLEPTFVTQWHEKYQYFKNHQLFITPEKYFDLLPAKIQLLIYQKQNQKWYERVQDFVYGVVFKPIPALASALLIILSFIILNTKKIDHPINSIATKAYKPSTTKVSIEEISQKEIIDYLDNDEQHANEIVELASNTKIKTTDIFKNKDIKVDHNTIEESISSEDIEELTLEEL